MSVLFFVFSLVAAAPPITAKNWRRHPLVVEVRQDVAAVDALAKAERLKKEERLNGACESYRGDMVRTVFRDASKRIRRFVIDQGSEDSRVTLTHDYDDSGRLRFVFITAGAVNGSELEHRIYVGRDGKRLWETHVYTKGPGYTFPSVWPQEELAVDAGARWARTLPCEAEVAPQ